MSITGYLNKAVLAILYISCFTACDMFQDESTASTKAEILISVEVAQGSGADTVSLSLRPISGDTEIKTKTLTTGGGYIHSQLKFDGLAAGVYQVTAVVTGSDITELSEVSELTVLPGNVHTSRLLISNELEVQFQWQTAAGLVPGISMDNNRFDAVYFKRTNNINSSDNMNICTAAGNFINLDSFYVRYPDGHVLSTAADIRAPHLWGMISSTDSYLISVRFNYYSTGDYIIRAEDFNGAAVTRSDDQANTWDGNELVLAVTPGIPSIVDWYFSEGDPGILNYCVFIFSDDGSAFIESAMLDGTAVSYSVSSAGNYKIIVLALDSSIDSEYADEVISNDNGQYQDIEDVPIMFALRNVQSSLPRNFNTVYYAVEDV